MPDTPCLCPPGYTLLADGITCEKVTETSPIVSSTVYFVCQGSQSIAYTGGAKFYSDITLLPKPLGLATSPIAIVDQTSVPVPVLNTVTAAPWGTVVSRLNTKGVWTSTPSCPQGLEPLPLSEWIGFAACVQVPETKKYCIGIGGDNGIKITINGNLILQIVNCSTTYQFLYWHVFEITLDAGLNSILLEGYNCSNSATFGAEIYDATPAALAAMTTSGQIDAVTIFSTGDMIGQNFDTGANSGYTCPEGYNLVNCGGEGPSCVLVEQTGIGCCYKLTDCKGILPSIYTDTDLSAYVIVQIAGYEGTCWEVSPDSCPDTSIPVTVTDSFDQCEECNGRYFTLNDCCCEEPLIIEGQIIVLNYTGTGYNPDNLLGLGITEIKDKGNKTVFIGCSYLNEITVIPPNSAVIPYGGYLVTPTTVDNCDECKRCIQGYKLQDCTGENDPIYTTSDLSGFLDQSITINGYPDVCWLVIAETNICEETVDVEVIQIFPDCVICLTQYYKLTNCLDPESTPIITAVNLSANLGDYIKLDDSDTICYLVEETDQYENAVPVSKAEGPDSYPDCLTCLPKAYLLKDCEKIQPDLVVGTDLSVYVGKVIKIKYCDTCYLVEEIIPGQSTNQIEVDQSFADCLECLPPNLPPPPVELITRRVKPGYYTKGCPPEYTEKVSCNFGETMFDDVARVRYGIDICCDHDVEKWWIKKQILNLKAIYDPALDVPVKPTCYCYTITQGVGVNIFKYINCEGSCTNVTVAENTSINVCAMYSPKLVCPSDNDNFEIIKSNTECLSVEDCSETSPYVCVTISNEFKPEAQVAAFSIERGGIATFIISGGQSIQLCTDPSTITVISGNPTIDVSTTSCLNDLECESLITCICYEIIAEGSGDLNYIDCEGQRIYLSINSTIRYAVCAQENSIVSDTQVSITPLGECDGILVCE